MRVFFGKFNEKWAGLLPPLNMRERFTLYPFAVGAIVLGVFPFIIFEYMNTGMFDLIAHTQGAAANAAKLAGL